MPEDSRMLRAGFSSLLTIALLMVGLPARAQEPGPPPAASFPLPNATSTAGFAAESSPAAAPSPAPAPTSEPYFPPPQSPRPQSAQAGEPASYASSPASPASPPPTYDGERTGQDASASDQWMWSLEGVTHAPIDVGFQSIIDTPVGLRLGGGFGWVPGMYLDMVTDNADSTDPAVGEAVTAFDGGTIWRLQVGLRPVAKLGFYIDAGYARANINGAVGASDLGVAGLPTVARYEFSSTLDLWFAELGYQGHLADHVVAGIGVGLIGTLNSSTEADASESPIPITEGQTQMATDAVDDQIEGYGFIPTVTLRFGLDII